MITTTITTVTAVMDLSITLGLVAVVALIAFLCVRELAAAGENSKLRFLAKSLDVAIAPLIIAFIIIVAVKVMEVLA